MTWADKFLVQNEKTFFDLKISEILKIVMNDAKTNFVYEICSCKLLQFFLIFVQNKLHYPVVSSKK